VKVTGATVFFVDESLDGGPIIAQDTVRVLEGDTVESLSARILEVEHRLLPLAITLIAQGRTVLEGRRVRILDRNGGAS
jgi:phosphoribosylglycinamide formyltransferase-1